MLISVHVDDYVVSTNSEEWYSKFVTAFKKAFEVNEVGKASNLLQIGIEWTQGGEAKLSQKRHIEEMAEAHGITNCKPIYTPTETGLHLEPA